MGKRKGHAWCEILARGISGFLRKAGREVPLFLENTNTSTLRNVASYCSLRSETLYLLFRLFSAGNDFRLWYSFEGSVCKGKRKTNQSFGLILDGRGKACIQGWFSQATKRGVIRALMTWWKPKIGGIKLRIPSCAYESIDYDLQKLKSEVEVEG